MYRTSEKTSLSRKMAELEDRWRKSQEDRYILELKFKEVLKGLANKNEGNKLLKIREKYNRFLENEDGRNERNDRILRTLDKIESQANMLSAKTERLKLLKLHYEAYMKRMYPTWEKEVNSGEVIVNKDHVYSGSRKNDQRNVYSTHRDEATINNQNSMVYSPRQSEKLHVTSPDFQRGLINGSQTDALSNYRIGDVNPPHSIAENIGVQRLNRDFSRVGMNSEEKTTSSHGPSFELEENTSKDLLNVSLSDDNIHDDTAPVDTDRTRKGKKDVGFHLRQRHTEAEDGNIPLQKNSMDRYASLQYGKGDVSDIMLNNNRGNVENDNITSLSEKKHSDVLNENESRVVRESTSELQPNVVVTQPTPDIGKSSSEDDASGRGIIVGDKKSKRRGSSHETSGLTSEAEVSEADGIPSESGDDYRQNVKEIADAELSPRPTTSFGNNQNNVEEPFQFSSSDADYDELENQMAALVEGKRNDKSKRTKHVSQSVSKNVLNENHDGNEPIEHVLDNIGNQREIPSDTTDEEMNQQKKTISSDDDKVIEGGSGDLSSDNVEKTPFETNSKDQKRNSWEHMQDSDTFSEKEVVLLARDNMEEVERFESYDPSHNEGTSKLEGSVDYTRPDEEVENVSTNTRQANDEKYNQQDVIRGDTSGGEGVEHENDDRYLEEPEAEVENDYDKSYGKEGNYYEDTAIKTVEVAEDDYDNENKKDIETGGGDSNYNERDNDFQVEQPAEDNSHFEKNTEELEINNAADEEDGYTQDGYDQEDQKLTKPESELQEETWVEEEKDEVESMAQEMYIQPEGQEEIEVRANDEYVAEQDEVEQVFSKEVVEGGDNLEELINEKGDRAKESYEVMENQRDETDQKFMKEEQESYERQGEEGEAEESTFERETVRDIQEEYDDGVSEGTNMMENYGQEEVETEIGEYRHDEADQIIVDPHEFLDEGHKQEIELPVTDQEKQYDADVHMVSETVEEAYAQGEEKKEISEEKNVHDTTQEEKEPGNQLQEQENVEKADVSEIVDAYPKTEIIAEPDVVKREDHIRQSPEQKELREVNKERTPGGKVEKPGIGEVRAVSQKMTKKEEGQSGKSVRGTQKEKESARKDAEHNVVERPERPTKDSSQVPSRPLSRQSTRKDGPSPDTYKGEKLKTAIRKFQAKKDTRQTTRRPADSKK